MVRDFTWACATFLLAVALTACEDEYEKMFEVFPINELKQDSSIPVSELFPGEWETICVVEPGDIPIRTINNFLPGFDADWLKDRRIQEYDFPDGLFKIILIRQDQFRALIFNKNSAEFSANQCAAFRTARLNIGSARKSGWNTSPIPLAFNMPMTGRLN